jgi:hypothetical protein
VDATVPVEAAEEDRVEFRGTEDVLRPVHHMIQFVRIFARDVAESGLRETAGNVGGKAMLHIRA